MSEEKRDSVESVDDVNLNMSTNALIEQKFKEGGGFGTFQVFACFSLICGINSQAWWMYNLGYLIQPPTYLCLIDG